MIIAMGDTHLAPRAWTSIPEVVGDSYRSFEQLVKFAIDGQASALVLAGDVFDAPPPAETTQFFIAQMLKLQEAKIPVYAVQGQHARDRHVPWTSVYPYVIHLTKDAIEVEPGIFMAGLDNLPPDELKAALTTIDPRTNILILHQMARGSVPEIAGRQNWDFDPEWVPPTVDLVLMGDLHEPWEKVLERDQFITRLYYSGSTCMQSLNEPPDKSFLCVELEGDGDGEALAVRRVPLNTRPFQRVTVLAEEVMERYLQLVAGLAPGTLCHLRFDPRVPAVEARMRAANSRIYFKAEPLSVSEEMEQVDLKQGQQVSLLSCLDETINRQTDSELHSFLWALLEAEEPRDVIIAEREKRLGSPLAAQPIGGSIE